MSGLLALDSTSRFRQIEREREGQRIRATLNTKLSKMEETETTFEIYILKIFKMQKCMHGNKKLKCTNLQYSTCKDVCSENCSC